MSVISGEVKNIIFKNNENGYMVFKLDNITCRGYVDNVKEGNTLSVEGEYVNHPKYGRQFEVVSVCMPENESLHDIEKYLASGQFKGIGVSTAKAIVKEFGKNTFQVIEQEPLRLLSVKRMTEKKALQLSESILKKKQERDAFVFLQRYGITSFKSRQIYNFYKERLYDVITKNPYQIIKDIKGIGFITADEIAVKVGIKKHSKERIKAGIVYCMEQDMTYGNTCMVIDELIINASNLLGVKEKQVEVLIYELESEKRIVLNVYNECTYVFLKEFDDFELLIADKLKSINSVKFQCDDEKYKRFILEQEENGYKYDDLKKEALKFSIEHGVVIITGGAGVGKTTTINLLIKYYEKQKMRILLASPTGRASKRMEEATGREAKTIHRLLEVQSIGNDNVSADLGRFGVNEKNPLDADVVIIDEMSMVDIYLFLSLVKAVKKGTRLILVGDKNQLPSVNPGQILKDLIESEQFPVIYLKKPFRQDADSDIYINANMINNGIMPDLRKESKNFAFIEKNKIDDAFYAITQEIKRVSKELRINPLDVLVLSPLRKGGCGTEELNARLQCYFNPQDGKKAEIYYGDKIYREGDKVTHLHNSYFMQTYKKDKESTEILSLKADALGVFNGEVGFIMCIDKIKETILVRYGDYYVYYTYGELNLLEHAFSQTVHKAQGGEADAVVFVIMARNMLLSTSVLYTAITRAKEYLSIIGKTNVLESIIEENKIVNRRTGLISKLKM